MQLIKNISFLSNSPVFIKTEPEIITSQGVLVICGNGKKVKLPLPQDAKEAKFLMGVLNTLFTNVVTGWNLKSLFSYFERISGSSLTFSGDCFDLKLLEFPINVNKSAPDNFPEAIGRLKFLVNHSKWKNLSEIYKNVYFPLLSEVVPSMENCGIGDRRNRSRARCSYDFFQVNGRLKCSGIDYNPHVMTPDDKQNLLPANFEDSFMYFDFKHMEVSVLAWLSNDPLLNKIVRSGEDVYNGIWTVLTGQDEVSAENRRFCKSIFLPVVFGLGKKGMAEKTKIDKSLSNYLWDLINTKFKVSFDWIRSFSGSLVEDHFGFVRNFENNSYKIRNFLIQSPSSLICLMKLVQLHKFLKNKNYSIAFHVHDGYCVCGSDSELDQTKIEIVKLMEESVFDNLFLRVKSDSGKRLVDIC